MEIKSCPFCGSSNCEGLNATWRTIETAPKDGTEILANTYKGVAVIIWDIEEACWCFVSQIVPCYAFLKSAAPTHWMPIPPPPNPHR